MVTEWKGSYTVELTLLMAIFFGILLLVVDTGIQFYQEVEESSGLPKELKDFSAVDTFRKLHIVDEVLGGEE